MPGTDNINELISNIELEGHDYVLAIIKQNKENQDINNLEIYTNSGDEPLNKLLKVLKDYKKTRDAKVIDKKKE